MPQSFHISCDIIGALRDLRRRRGRWSYFNDDDGRPMTRKAAIAGLERELSAGRTGLPGSGCDNFDPITGRCLGHEKPARGAAIHNHTVETVGSP